MTKIRTFLLLILISLIVTLSVQLTEKFSDKPEDFTPLQRNANIDYSIDDFTLTSMDINGKTQYHLNASSMKHFQDTNETLVQAPSIELHNKSGHYWNIQAENGQVTEKSKSILLSGKVNIKRSATKQQKPFIITTESLLINAENNTVSTDETIQLVGDGISLKSKGMFTNLQTETIKFLSKVRGTYAP